MSRFPLHSLVLALALAAGTLPAARAADPGGASQHTLNIKDADITTVIDAVSRMTGKNFVVDPRVKGKVTVISSKPMDSEEIYQVFLSVLKVHGYAAVPGRNIIKIIPEVAAKQDAVQVVNGGRRAEGDEFVTRVIEVRHVQAAQLVPILRPLVPQRGHLAAHPASNVLVISDSAANIERLARIIARIDHATSDEVEVIPLRNASATEIVKVLERLERKDPKAKAARGPTVVADDRTNSILLGGPKAGRLRLRALIAHLDTSVEVGGQTHVVYLRNANAKDLVQVLTGISQNLLPGGKGKKGVPAVPGTGVTIQADESTNALVINAPPDVFRSLRRVIQKLDVRRAQVLVEAVIAEVSHDVTKELGVQWAFDGRQGGNAIGLINFTVGTPITALANLENPPSITGFNFGVGDLTGSNPVAALISALESDADSNILSTPSILTLDNEEAELIVGQNVPFITGSFSGTGGGSTPTNPFQTIERKDVGLTLKIKPQINEGNAIKMDVLQEVSSVSPATQGVDIITNKRSIRTSVMVEDGQMVVLGGLIQDELRETEQKVPGLGDIPLLGWLFRYHRTQKVKTNLMVFLRPTIVNDPALQAGFTADKYNYLRGEQLAARERNISLVDEEEAPLAPELKSYITLPPPFEGEGGVPSIEEPPVD